MRAPSSRTAFPSCVVTTAAWKGNVLGFGAPAAREMSDRGALLRISAAGHRREDTALKTRPGQQPRRRAMSRGRTPDRGAPPPGPGATGAAALLRAQLRAAGRPPVLPAACSGLGPGLTQDADGRRLSGRARGREEARVVHGCDRCLRPCGSARLEAQRRAPRPARKRTSAAPPTAEPAGKGGQSAPPLRHHRPKPQPWPRPPPRPSRVTPPPNRGPALTPPLGRVPASFPPPVATTTLPLLLVGPQPRPPPPWPHPSPHGPAPQSASYRAGQVPGAGPSERDPGPRSGAAARERRQRPGARPG